MTNQGDKQMIRQKVASNIHNIQQAFIYFNDYQISLFYRNTLYEILQVDRVLKT